MQHNTVPTAQVVRLRTRLRAVTGTEALLVDRKGGDA
jgi:hypothetical protein